MGSFAKRFSTLLKVVQMVSALVVFFSGIASSRWTTFDAVICSDIVSACGFVASSILLLMHLCGAFGCGYPSPAVFVGLVVHCIFAILYLSIAAPVARIAEERLGDHPRSVSLVILSIFGFLAMLSHLMDALLTFKMNSKSDDDIRNI